MYTHTHTYTDFLSVIFKEGKDSNWFWARGLGIRVFVLLPTLSDWTNELLGIGVVWGNAEEKVQIVNALAKVRYGGGRCWEDDEETEKHRSSQVMETRVKKYLEFPK